MIGAPWWLAGLVGLVSGGGLVGGIATIVGARWSAKVGIQGNEIKARADEATAEDRLIGRLETVLAAETTRADRAEKALTTERDYTESLRQHIWDGKKPPPPNRTTD